MNEDPEEIVFHVSLLAVLLRGLKLRPPINTATAPYISYPLFAQVSGLCVSIGVYPHLAKPAGTLALEVADLIQVEGKRTSTWPEVYASFQKLLEAVQSPIPAWVRKEVAITEGPQFRLPNVGLIGSDED